MLKAAEDGEEAVAWAENHREWQRINTTCDAQEGTRVHGEACTAVDRRLIAEYRVYVDMSPVFAGTDPGH